MRKSENRFGCIYRNCRILLFVIFWLSLSDIYSQNFIIKGKIIDSKSKAALAFVNIIIDKNKIVTTDIDGSFVIKENRKIDSVTISYLGYKPLVYYFNKSQKSKVKSQNAQQAGSRIDVIIIQLERDEIALPEVTVIPGVNPALRIINNVINNKGINNPERLEAFSYTSYNKMVFTVDADSIKKKGINKLDSTDKKVISTFSKMHLFIMESVAEHEFRYPDKHSEQVVATKTSGLKEPILVMLASQFQSFSFYNDYVSIAEKKYLNPISRGNLKKYIYILKDTLYSDKDTIFIISFQSRINKNIDGLTGVIYINSNRYAIQNVIAKPSEEEGKMSFRIQQQYEFINNDQWFPVQLNTDIVFKNLKVKTSNVIAHGNTYIRDITINSPEKIKGNTDFEVMPDAGNKSEAYWKVQRKDSLTKQELKTYKIIDSIGEKNHLDRIAKNLENIMLGKISFGFIDFEIGRFIKFSDYEGISLGLGMQTNNKISKKLSIGGYYSYAFKINEPIYGSNFRYLINKKAELTLRLSYVYDYEETGGHKFFDRNEELLNPDNFSDFLVMHKDRIERKECNVGFRMLKYANMFVGLSDTRKEITNDYKFGIGGENVKIKINTFDITELTIGVRYAYNEKFIKTPYYKLSAGTNYPIIWLQYKKGFNNLLNGYFNYNQYDIKIRKSFDIKNIGQSSFELQAGYIDNNIPLSNLYNGEGTYRKFTIAAPYSFATMRFNEFFTDKFVNLFFTHSFGNLLFKNKKFKPEFVIATNISYGTMQNKDSHYDITFNTPDKGYFESGFLINKLINMKFYYVGVGCYYRYGHYQFNKTIDNVAAKLSLVFPLMN